MQVLYGILVQHFAILAGQAPLPIAHLEALTKQLLDLTAEVPFYAATVARARLSRLQERLESALSDPVSLPCRVSIALSSVRSCKLPHALALCSIRSREHPHAGIPLHPALASEGGQAPHTAKS